MKIKSYMEGFIRDNYITMTQKEIANSLGDGVTANDVQYWLRKNNLWKQKNMFSKDAIDFMVNNYKTMEYSEIADYLNLIERQVRGKINNMGLSKTRKFDKYYFHNIDSATKAYILGFIYADGYVVKNVATRNYEFAMQLQSEDKYILEKINDELGGVHHISHINPKEKIIDGHKTISGHQDYLRVYSKDIVDDLISHGIVPDKTHNYEIPIFPQEYFFDFLRGYIAGDGCYYNSGKNVYMHITCACSYVLEWIQQILQSYEINTYIKKEKELKYRLYCTNTNDMKTLMNLLYYDGCALYLYRKYDKIKYLLDGRLD